MRGFVGTGNCSGCATHATRDHSRNASPPPPPLVPLYPPPPVSTPSSPRCTLHPQSGSQTLPVSLIVGLCIAGGVAVLLIPVGIYAWLSTRRLRLMRKQFSNDNVAEKCAEAIARFDLDEVCQPC